MSLPEQYISFARIILFFSDRGGCSPLSPPAPYTDAISHRHSDVAALIHRVGQESSYLILLSSEVQPSKFLICRYMIYNESVHDII